MRKDIVKEVEVETAALPMTSGASTANAFVPVEGVAGDSHSSRLPKQDRSRITRDQLLSTAVTSLARSGWQATTVGVVAKLSGLTRGAAQHHFPTREDLFVAVVEHMFDIRANEIRQATATFTTPTDSSSRMARAHQVLSIIVQYYTDDVFKAALQVWLASVSEKGLRERIIPLERRISREVFGLLVDSLAADVTDTKIRRKLQITIDLALGMGVEDLISDGSERRTKIVTAWSEELESIVGTRKLDRDK